MNNILGSVWPYYYYCIEFEAPKVAIKFTRIKCSSIGLEARLGILKNPSCMSASGVHANQKIKLLEPGPLQSHNTCVFMVTC